MLRILFGQYKRYAEQHLTCWAVLEATSSKTNIFENTLVQQVNYLSCLLHIPCKPVRVPRYNAVISTCLNVIYHLTKFRTYIWLFSTLFLTDWLTNNG